MTSLPSTAEATPAAPTESVPLFSVVIAAYNASPFIEQTMRSVDSQSDRDFELIVVDDGSSDNTADLADRLETSHPKRVIRQANGGPGAARNTGVNNAAGRYIVFLDADDLLQPDALAIYRQAIQQNAEPPSLVLGAPQPFQSGDDIRPLIREHAESPRFARYGTVFDAASRKLWFGTTVMVVDRDRFKSAGGFALGNVFFEDLEVALRTGSTGAFVVVEQPPTVLYRQHAGNRTRHREVVYRGAGRILSLERNGSLPGGAAGRAGRRRLVCRAVRAVCVAEARAGRPLRAARLYLASLDYQLLDGRWLFAFGAPAVLAVGLLRRSWRAAASRLKRHEPAP